MDITQRYTTRSERQFLIRLSYNERIQENDSAASFVHGLEVRDLSTDTAIEIPEQAKAFSTYERYTTFGSYTAINYFGARETAIEGLRTKILTRVEDYLERA